MNRALLSLHGGLLEITLKVPLRKSVQSLLNDGLLISIMEVYESNNRTQDLTVRPKNRLPKN